MNLLQLISNWISFNLFGLNEHSVWGEAINYFIYDVIKIFLLLCIIIFIFSFIRTYLPQQKIRKILSRKNEFYGNILAAGIGIFTPFCTCSAIPLFMGFLEAGVPLGVTFSYLIAAPLINEIAAVLLLALFGWKVAVIYIASGFVLAVLAGFILGKLKLEKYVIKFGKFEKKRIKKLTFKERLLKSKMNTWFIIKKVFPWILIGVGIGAFIHGYAPQDFLSGLGTAWYALPLAVIIGVPLYSNAAGVIPIVKELLSKGLPLGTSLAFMMSVTALSLPEMLILRKVLKPKLLILYFSIVAFGILLIGYLFNILM